MKCYLFHTLPTYNRQLFHSKINKIHKSVKCSRVPSACGVQCSTERLVKYFENAEKAYNNSSPHLPWREHILDLLLHSK